MEKEEKELNEGIAEFYEMFADFIRKRLGKQIEHFLEHEEEGIRITFRKDLYQLFSLHLGKERKILLFSNLRNIYPSFRDDLLRLFSFLEFVIDDKSK